jgi:hypothetical protein
MAFGDRGTSEQPLRRIPALSVGVSLPREPFGYRPARHRRAEGGHRLQNPEAGVSVTRWDTAFLLLDSKTRPAPRIRASSFRSYLSILPPDGSSGPLHLTRT